jgi:hypothetical protein
MVLVCLWTVVYPLPDVGMKWLVFGLSTVLAAMGLFGLWWLRRPFFLSAILALALIHILSLVETALVTVQDILAASLLLLMVVFLAELGGVSILYSRIALGIKELSDGEVASRIGKAMSRHLIETYIVASAAFLFSCGLLLLGSVSVPLAMPSYVVAAEIAVLLVGIVLLGSRRNRR